MSVGIAVVGVGWAGSRHVEAVRELAAAGDDRLHIEMLVDNDPDHLAERAREYAVEKTFIDLQKALEDPEVRAVSIASPHGLHHSQAIAAAAAGRHVMVEKPMAVSVEQAREMQAAADANGVQLCVAENQTYSPMTVTLRQLVESGEFIGPLTHAAIVAGFRAEPRYQYPGRREWLSNPSMGGSGTWLLHGIHTIAQMRAILGEVETVYARESHTPGFPTPEVEGTMTALFGMRRGISATLVQSCETRFERDQRGYALHGESGTIRANAEGARAWRMRESSPIEIRYPESPLSDYALEFQAFSESIESGEEGPTSGRSELRSLAIVQAGYESEASGDVVNLEARFGVM